MCDAGRSAHPDREDGGARHEHSDLVGRHGHRLRPLRRRACRRLHRRGQPVPRIDERTTQAARLLAARGFTAVDYDRRGRGRSRDTAPWALEREVEDLAALIKAVGGPATLYTSSSGAAVALAAASAGAGVASLALYEPPFFRGRDFAEHLAALRSLLADGKNDEAMRYNLTSVIGLPPGAVAGMAQQPWWPALAAAAPTLLYDHTATHEISLDPD
jgi:pimeloyl-ACP methyl ester carboxylesterase